MTRHLMASASSFALLAFALVAPATVSAQSLDSFGVLAGSTVTNTGPSVIEGNVGLSPGSSIVGFPPGSVLPPLHDLPEQRRRGAGAERSDDRL